MKSRVESSLLCLFLLLSAASFSQQTFEPGYFIDGDGKRETVQILFEDWRYNPANIQVRRAADQEAITVPTGALREFGIDGKARYVNREVAIEKSYVSRTTRATSLPLQRIERVLLRVDVEGKASLYSYLAPRVSKHFLSIDAGQLHQLVYTTHRAPDGSLFETRTFVHQLRRQLSCDGYPGVDNSLEYQLADLTRVVADYNHCADGATHTVYEYPTPREKALRFSLQPGFYFTRFKLSTRPGRERLMKSASHLTFRVGATAEYTLPYVDQELSVLFRPSYYRFSAAASLPEMSVYQLEYAAFDLPVALRYYYTLAEDVKVFTTGAIGIIVPFGALYDNGREISKVKGTVFTSAEVGVRYRKRYDLAIGYETQRNCLSDDGLRATTPGLRITTGYLLL